MYSRYFFPRLNSFHKKAHQSNPSAASSFASSVNHIFAEEENIVSHYPALSFGSKMAPPHGSSTSASATINSSHESMIISIGLASLFMLFAALGTTLYYYHRRRSSSSSSSSSLFDFGKSYNRSGPKTALLINRDIIPLEKSFLISPYCTATTFNNNGTTTTTTTTTATNATTTTTPPGGGAPFGSSSVPGKTRAVRSPSSGQVNPFGKHSKSPSPTAGKESAAIFAGTGNTASATAIGNIEVSPSNGHSGKQATTEINANNNNCGDEGAINHNQQQQQQQQPPRSNVKASAAKDSFLAHRSASTSSKKYSIGGSEDLDDASACSIVSPNLGTLHFKLKYNYEKRALCLIIIRCADLPVPSKESGSGGGGGASNSTMDAYVKMQLLPEKQHKAKTRVIRRSQNPIYNEEFTFYGITPNFLETMVVHFVVLKFDRFSRDEILGEVVCKLNQFEFDSLEKQITVARDIVPRGNKSKIVELGEVLISLCYQPIANRLTVVVLKARNLPKMDLTGLCDPYVKIYVFHKQQRIFKKRTHVKKRTLSPVFNESFVFDIPPEEGLDNIAMQFLVYDHDRVTRNELIGKIEIGCKAGNAIAEKHWNEVIKAPRRQIAEWHKLRQ